MQNSDSAPLIRRGFVSKIVAAVLGNKEVRVLILGLDNAGKTTILYKLQMGEVVTTVPSARSHLALHTSPRTQSLPPATVGHCPCAAQRDAGCPAVRFELLVASETASTVGGIASAPSPPLLPIVKSWCP